MKVCIVGLGAIGGLLAAWMGTRLPAGTVTLSALARGATLVAVRDQGLLLETGAGPDTATISQPVLLHASDDAAALGVQDLVILAGDRSFKRPFSFPTAPRAAPRTRQNKGGTLRPRRGQPSRPSRKASFSGAICGLPLTAGPHPSVPKTLARSRSP